ncbi:hypothetical protein CONPUDRAFT_103716 [Coniophora puteana RWD-64-598 SS2]|uniref:DUF336-domain-containing protein n=1 Tax=Coniophora puteana (strain RWD-64-598) TaxID=741705 RepID=A0A5M3MTS7_CONPW|nr:uncharacterized protein CONPUDRAFT_103716 [Coniophora puteana RWD-64-598 SS2]EIW82490.1 hypothetical protein CONPUDRAFT_103716 [Coniophora puteana RWD-64-598 SS2]
MFSQFQPISPSDAELASATLIEEGTYRFPSFSASDAVTLGLSLRKRFRASSRHARGKGALVSVQDIAGHTLFACTVGDLANPSGAGDVGLEAWARLEEMVRAVRRTGHSSYYIERAVRATAAGAAAGKQGQAGAGVAADFGRVCGGAFPVWLENAHSCPIGIIALYSGSSQEDHHLVVGVVRDYIHKQTRDLRPPPSALGVPSELPPRSSRDSREWIEEPAASHYTGRSQSPYSPRDDEGDY